MGLAARLPNQLHVVPKRLAEDDARM